MVWFGIAGVVTSSVFGDLLLLICMTIVIYNYVTPAVRTYQASNKTAKKIGNVKKHWFWGNLKMFPANKKGLMKRVALTLDNPAWVANWMGPIICEVVLHHADTAITMLSSATPKNRTGYRFLRPWIGDGLLTSSGKKWQRNRRLLTTAFHFEILKPYGDVFNECVKVMLDKWEAGPNNQVEIYKDISLMTLDAMLQCAMSNKSNCQKIGGRNEYIEAVHDLSMFTIQRAHSPLMHIDWIYWLSREGRKCKKALDIVHRQSEKVISERKKVLLMNTGESDRGRNKRKHLDFLDILLQTKDEDGIGLSDKEIQEEVDTFLFEGHDTTASGIAWALYNLASNENCQDKCREELRRVVGEKENIDWDELSKLPYLTMCIKESLRLYPPVPFIGRELKEPLQFHSDFNKTKQTTIEAKSQVALHIFSLHRNVHVWESPHEYNPERFNPENIKGRSPHAYLPFSAGPRNCIGQNFALNELKISIGQTIRRFKLYTDETTPTPIIKPALVLRPTNGIHIKFQPV